MAGAETSQDQAPNGQAAGAANLSYCHYWHKGVKLLHAGSIIHTVHENQGTKSLEL